MQEATPGIRGRILASTFRRTACRSPSRRPNCRILCFVDRASRCNCVKKNHLVAQLILSIFRQPLRVSGVSGSIITRYNHMYTTIGTYYYFLDDCLLSCLDWIPIQPEKTVIGFQSNQDRRKSSKKE